MELRSILPFFKTFLSHGIEVTAFLGSAVKNLGHTLPSIKSIISSVRQLHQKSAHISTNISYLGHIDYHQSKFKYSFFAGGQPP